MAITAIRPQKEDEKARKPLARADTQFSIVARRFRRHRLAMVSLLVLGVIFTASILAKQALSTMAGRPIVGAARRAIKRRAPEI